MTLVLALFLPGHWSLSFKARTADAIWVRAELPLSE